MLIHAKLRPPQHDDQVLARPRIDERLTELVAARRVVAVCASPGSGKTTAVADAARRLELPLAWLTVDTTDRSAGRLVTYLEAAIARVVSTVDGVATGALAAGIPHAEAAGILAEAVGDRPLLLVVDDLERLGDETEPWAVMEALVRYAPPRMRIVLVSRRNLPAVVQDAAFWARIGALGEQDLAFTADEAAAALARLGRTEVDAEDAVRATGGWVMGVLFEAWRYDEHLIGTGGEADPLSGYLSSNIIGQLAASERELLVTTSLLHEVTAQHAEEIGVPDAGERLRALKAHRIPVAWSADGRVMRCHPRFREYLLERLEERGREQARRVRLAYGRLLARHGHDEDATEELLRAGEPAEALASAERAIGGLIERLDFAVADRWLRALAGVAPAGATALTNAELMLAIARDDHRGAIRIADELKQLGELERLARGSEITAALLAWCYGQVGRLEDGRAVLDGAVQGPAVAAMRYAFALIDSHTTARRPEPTGGPLDPVIYGVDYILRGCVSQLTAPPKSSWFDAVTDPWRIGALQLAGRTEQALELYADARAAGAVGLALEAPVGPSC